jgi:hypothetical protein
MENTQLTHDIFFRVITQKKMNELLHRADPSTRFLENEINMLLVGAVCKTRIGGDCSIYINYFSNNGEEIGHISLHIIPENKTMRRYKVGRLHAKNASNINRRHTMRVTNTNGGTSMRLNIVRYPTIIRPAFMDCIRPTLDILNDYFDIHSQRSLQYALTENISNKHRCFDIIRMKMSSSKTPLRTTRKN